MKTSKLGKILVVALFIMLFALVLTVSAGAATTNVAAGADLSDAIGSAADGDVLVLGGGTYTETTITIDKNLTIQGTGTVNGGAPIFNIAQGVTVTFGGSVKYVGTGVGVSVTGNNTTVNFKDSVRFETKDRVYQDKNNTYTTTVTVAGSAFFKSSSYAMDFDGATAVSGTLPKKTVTVSGGTFECTHGIVFNADYIDAIVTVTGGTINNVNSCLWNQIANGSLTAEISNANWTSTKTSDERVFYNNAANNTASITINSGTFTSATYMFDNRGGTAATVTVNGGTFTSASHMFYATGSGTKATLNANGGTMTSKMDNSNSGAFWTSTSGAGFMSITAKNCTISAPKVSVFGANAATITVVLENATVSGLDLANENGSGGKVSVTVKGNSNVTAAFGLCADGTATNGSYHKLTIEGGTVKAGALASNGGLCKADMAVATTVVLSGGTLDLENPIVGSKVTFTHSGGTLMVNGMHVSDFETEPPVAQIGSTTYNSLADAIANAVANDTITILKNCTITTDITVDKKLTITGADVEVLFDGGKFVAVNGADLTLAGTIEWHAFTLLSNEGISSLTLNGGTFNGTGHMIKYDITANSTVTVNAGVTVNARDTFVARCDSTTTKNSAITTVNINGGTFNVYGHLFVGTAAEDDDDELRININGGTFNLDGSNKTATLFRMDDYQVKFVVTIEDGTFIGTNPVAPIYFLYNNAKQAEITLKGGTFTGFTYFIQAGRNNTTLNVPANSTASVSADYILYNKGIANAQKVANVTATIEGGSFTVGQYFLFTENTNDSTQGLTVATANVTITGGTFNKMPSFVSAGAGNVTLDISNVTIETTGNLFHTWSTDLVFNGTFKDCTLTAGSRLVGGDTKSQTLKFTNTNVTAYERMFNVTGGSNAANITIDGGTYTINVGTGTKHALMFYSSSTGTSTVVINSGTFINTGNGSNEWDTLFALNGGSTKMDVTIKDGTFQSKQIMQQGNGTLSITIEKGTFEGNNLFQTKGGTANVTVKAGTFTGARIVDGIKGTTNLTVYGGTFTTSNHAFYLVSGTFTATVHNMNLTSAGAGFKADAGTMKVTVNNATVNCTGTAYGCEPFIFHEACTSATLEVKAGTYTANTGLRGLYGRAQNGSYTFGTEGETDHSKLVFNTDNQQVFAFHTSGSYTITMSLVVYSGTYTCVSAPLLDVNTATTGSVTLHDGIYNGNSQSHSLIDLTGSSATNPSHVNVTVKAGTYNVANDYFINYSHCLQGKGVTITLNNPTVNFDSTGGQVVYVNGTGTDISYADVYITGGTYTNAGMMVHFDQCIGKVVISGGTAVLTSPYTFAKEKETNASATANDLNNDAYLVYLSGGACKLLEGSEISGGNYTVTLIDDNSGAIGGNTNGSIGNMIISGGSINVTNGPLFGFYTDWTASITGGTVTCKWLVNVNGGAADVNVTLSANANVTCTGCVATDGGAGSKIHIQMDGGALNTNGGWVTSTSFAATFTAQVTGGTYNGATYVANEQGVVVNGTTYYTDLQTAIDAANDGDTLTIVGGITITETININKSLTIEGGTAQQPVLVICPNYAFTKANGAYDTFRIAADKSVTFAGYVKYVNCGIQVASGTTEAGTTVTFKDNVVFDNNTFSHVLTNTATAGNVTVNIQGNAHLIGIYGIAFDTADSTGNKYVNMTGGTIQANHSVVFNTDGIVGHLYVENGTFIVNDSIAYFTTQSAGNTVVIENADVTSKKQLIFVSNPDGVVGGTVTATINGGTFVTSGTSSLFNSAGCGGSGINVNVFTVNIYGGSFTNTSESGSYNMFYATDANGALRMNIYGGTFTAAGAGTHTFARNESDAMIINIYGGKISGFTYFIAAARRNTTVVIDNYKDEQGNVLATPEISATYVFYGKYDYTAEGNSAGDNVTLNVTVNAGILTATEAMFYTDNSTRVATNTYTVNGGTFTTKNLLHTVSGTTTMTVAGGTVTASNNGFLLDGGSVELTVSGGTFTVTNHFVHQSESYNGTLGITIDDAAITAQYGFALYAKGANATANLTVNNMTLNAAMAGIRVYNVSPVITINNATIHAKGSAGGQSETIFIANVPTATVTVKAGTYTTQDGGRPFYFQAKSGTYTFGTEGGDNSKLTATSTNMQIFAIHVAGIEFDLIIHSGTYTVSGSNNLIDINEGETGSITINGGKFKTTTGGNMIDLAGNGNGASHVDITITGGEFDAKAHFLSYSMATGTANISGGTITAGNYGISLGGAPLFTAITDKVTVREGVEALPDTVVNLSGNVSITAVNRVISVVSSMSSLVNISGGTYTTTADGGYLIYRSNDSDTTDEFSVFNISDGTFNAKCENMFAMGNFTKDKTYTVITISGGTFNQQRASGNAYFFHNWDWNGNAIINISGGTFTGTEAATVYGFCNNADTMWIDITGNVSFTGVDNLVWANRGTTHVEIGADKNGNAPAFTVSGTVFYDYVSNTNGNAGTLNATVTAGTFSCAQLLLAQKSTNAAYAHLTVTGGTYTVSGDFITFNNASGIVDLKDITISGCTNGFVFTGAAPSISSKITDADKVQVSTSPALNEKPDVIVNLSGSFSLTTSGYAFTANRGPTDIDSNAVASDGGISTLVNISENVSLTSTKALFHRAGDTQNTWSVYNIEGGTFTTNAEIMLARDLMTKNIFTVMNISGGSFTAGGANLFHQTSAEGDKAYANINISGGSFTSTKSDSAVTFFSNGDWQGTMNVNITGGTFSSVGNKVNYFVYNNAQYMDVTFTGAEISLSLRDTNTGLFYQARVDCYLTIDVNGGSLACPNGPLFGVFGNVTANLNGGTVTGTWLLNENTANAHQVVANIYEGATVNITSALITDGTKPAATDTTSHVTVNIYGGNVSAPYYTTGAAMNVRCYVKFLGDCIYNGVAYTLGDGKILLNGSEYLTLEAALADAVDGDVLTLTQSFGIVSTVINKSVTITGNEGITAFGKGGVAVLTVTANASVTFNGYTAFGQVTIVGEGGTTVTLAGNVSFANDRNGAAIYETAGTGTVTLNVQENVNLNGYRPIRILNGVAADVNITGGTINANGGAIYIANEYVAANDNVIDIYIKDATITASFITHSELYASKSRITVEGNANLYSSDQGFYYNTTGVTVGDVTTPAYHNTEIIINGGIFNIADTTKHIIDMNDGVTGSITINGGDFNTNKVATAYIIDLANGCDIDITITGGTVHDAKYVIHMYGVTSKVTISGNPVFNTHERFLSVTGSSNVEVEISGGTVNLKDLNNGHALMFYAADSAQVDITINGGVFNNESIEIDQHNATFETNNADARMNLTLNGGTFRVVNFIWVYSGLVTVKKNEATVSAMRYSVNSVYFDNAEGHRVYGNIATVAATAPAGSTIVIPTSINVGGTTAVIDKSLTFTGEGVSVVGTAAIFKITAAATLTFEGNVSYKSALYIVRIDNNTDPFEATIHFKGGRFENTKSDGGGETKTIVSDYAPNNTTHIIVEDGVTMICKGWGLHFEGTAAADQNGYKTITMNGGSLSGSHGFVIRAGGVDFNFTVNGGSIVTGNEVFYIENDYYKTDAQENVGEVIINGGTLTAATNIFLVKDAAHVNITISGGTFNAPDVIEAEGNTVSTMTVTGGKYNVTRFAVLANTSAESKLTLTATGASISTTGAFFATAGGADSILDCTFTNCELSSGARFIDSDAKQLTFKFKDTNLSALERMFNVTGAGNTADVTIDGGTLTISPLTATGNSLMFYSNSQAPFTVTIKDGTFINTSTATGAHIAMFDIANNNANQLTVTIENGTFTGTRLIYAEKGVMNMTVKNGTFNTDEVLYLVAGGNATLTVEGGTFNCNALVNAPANSGASATVTMSGETAVTAASSVFNIREGNTVSLTVSGGTYTAPYAILVAYGTVTANLNGGTFEGLALYTHSALNWAPTVGDGAVINTTHRDYHHAVYDDGNGNVICGSIENVINAIPAGSTITVVGQIFSGTINVNSSVTITGTAADSVGDALGQTKINLGVGVAITFTGDLSFINSSLYANNNTVTTFMGNVRFLNGTSYDIYDDPDGNYNTTVIIRDNAYLQGNWGIDYEGWDTSDANFATAGHTGTKTLKMFGGIIDAVYGIVFNVDGVVADIDLTGGKIISTNDAIYLNAGNYNGKRLDILIDGIIIESEDLGINMVDSNTLVDITVKSGIIHSGMDGNTANTGDYCIEFYSAPNAQPSTLTILGGTFIADTAHAAIHVTSTNNANTKDVAPVAKIYAGYFEGHTLCAVRATTGGWLEIWGGYFAYLPEKYTDSGSPVRSGTGSETGHVEVYAGNFYTTGYGPAINCINDQSYLTVHTQGVQAVGGQYIAPERPNSTQHRYPDGDHEHEGLISMIDGAGVRLHPDSNGLRFVSIVTAEALAYIRSLGGTNLRFGTLIAPVDEIAKATVFSIEEMTRAGAQFINLPASNGLIERAEGGYYIRAALVNIREENIGRDFAATGYVQYELNGHTVTVYTAYRASRNARSIEQAARLALKDADKYTPAQLAILEGFAPTEAAPVIDFYLVAGQSNAAGSSNWTDAIMQIRPEYTEGFSHILYSGSSNTIHRLNTVTKLGYGSASDTFGIELGMADALSQYYNEETGRYAAIIKYAYGGTSLYDNITGSDAPEGNWQPPSWIETITPKSEVLTGGLFRALVNHVENSIAEYEAMGFEVNIVTAYWMQGESDVNRHASDGLYDDIFKCWVNDLRSALVEMTGEEKYEELPILVGEISEYFGDARTNAAYYQKCLDFVKMQREIIGSWENVYVIPQGNVPTADNNVTSIDHSHWGYHDHLWNGQMVGKAIMTLFLGQPHVVEDPVAEIWLNGEMIGAYESFSGAISLAPEGATVKLLKDLTLYSTLVIGNRNKITVDGNNHKIDVNSPNTQGYYSAIKFYATDITVKDLHIVNHTDNTYGMYTEIGAKITWIGGSIEAEQHAIVVNSANSELTIIGGEFKIRKTDLNYGAVVFTKADNVTITINGGTFDAGEGTGYAVYVDAASTNSTVTVTEGTLIAGSSAPAATKNGSSSTVLTVGEDVVIG